MIQYIYERKRIYFGYNDFHNVEIPSKTLDVPIIIPDISFQSFLEYVWVDKLNKLGAEGWKIVTVDNYVLKGIYEEGYNRGEQLKTDAVKPCYMTLFVKQIEG